jgi:predicted TIM-barrel fold metal-dependent hydrolase
MADTAIALPSTTGFAPATIVDAHMHVGDYPLFDVRMTADDLRATFAHYGIAAGMVFDYDNQYVREVVESVEGAYGLVWANPNREGFLEEALDLLEHPRFLGVKMHPLFDAFLPDDPRIHPLVEALIERDMPALFHCGHPIYSLPWSFEALAVRYPAAKIILGHMGHGNVVYINGAIGVAERNPNVYLETSGMPMHTKIAEAIRRVGEDRVLFGSDAPFHEIGVEVRKVQVSGLSPELVTRVLEKNSRKLFFGDEHAQAPIPRDQRGSVTQP